MEETKFGLDIAEARQFLDSAEYHFLKNIKICGVMGMATLTDDTQTIRNEFHHLKNIFDSLKKIISRTACLSKKYPWECLMTTTLQSKKAPL